MRFGIGLRSNLVDGARRMEPSGSTTNATHVLIFKMGSGQLNQAKRKHVLPGFALVLAVFPCG